MNRSKYTEIIIVLIAVITVTFTACGRSSSHCYLCQGIPHDEPCIVNLATGEIAVLSVGGYGHAELSMIGGVSVTGINGESCEATIPISGEKVNPALFCEDCRERIAATPNNGYALADLKALSNVQLYPIEDIAIRNYILTVSTADNAYDVQMVTS